MDINTFLKSILHADRSPVVICNMEHEIIYMNPVAVKSYEKYGGVELLGKSLLDCHSLKAAEKIKEVLKRFMDSPDEDMVYEFRNAEENKDVYMVALRDENGELIGYYEKHEYRNNETAELYEFV